MNLNSNSMKTMLLYQHKRTLDNELYDMLENAYSFNVITKIKSFKSLRTYMIKHPEHINNLVKMGLIDIAKEGIRSQAMILRYEAMSIIQNIVFHSEEFYDSIKKSGIMRYVKKYTKYEKELPNMFTSATFIISKLVAKKEKAVVRKSL